MKIQWGRSCSMQTDVCDGRRVGITVRHDKDSSRVSQLCECT